MAYLPLIWVIIWHNFINFFFSYRLRIDIVDYFGDLKYADYGTFYIDGEDQNYALHVDDYSGDAGTVIIYDNRNTFIYCF